MSPTDLDRLAELQISRKFCIGLANRQTNACKALVRRHLGWRYDMDEAERAKLNVKAAKEVALVMTGKGSLVLPDLEVARVALAPLLEHRHKIELLMKSLVRKMPVYAWAKTVHGFGELGLAVVLAEAGDLAGYPSQAHLWKRLGLAPHAGKAYSSWRRGGGLSAEDWEEAGYSPGRLAQIFGVVTEPLLRQQTVVNGPYRAVYDRRRAATLVSHPDWIKAHSHADALRVMTKMLLRDLWKANRRALERLSERTRQVVPAGRRTVHDVSARAGVEVFVGTFLKAID